MHCFLQISTNVQRLPTCVGTMWVPRAQTPSAASFVSVTSALTSWATDVCPSTTASNRTTLTRPSTVVAQKYASITHRYGNIPIQAVARTRQSIKTFGFFLLWRLNTVDSLLHNPVTIQTPLQRYWKSILIDVYITYVIC